MTKRGVGFISEANVRAAEKARNDMAAQVRGLQDALTRSQADGQKLKATLSTVVTQLSVAQANLAFVQANLALANRRIVKLGGMPVRQ